MTTEELISSMGYGWKYETTESSARLVAEHAIETMYSAEEVLKILHNYRNHFELYRNIQVLPNDFFEWFEQFKK
jgi:hypothetical protein